MKQELIEVNKEIDIAIKNLLEEEKDIQQSFNIIIDHIYNICFIDNYDIPENKIVFCLRLLGKANVSEKTLFLLQGLFYKDEFVLKKLVSNPCNETILLLKKIKFCLDYLDNIFSKKENHKIKNLKLYN